MVTTANLENRITELVKNEQIQGIADLGGGPTRDGLKFIIETKKDIVPEVLMNQLFKVTQLQSNFAVNMLALVDGVPKTINIKEAIVLYIKHQIDVITRRVNFDLKKATEREHILQGLHVATKNIDEIIKTIRKSNSNEETITALVNQFKLSEIQAKAISEMRLGALNGLGVKKIEAELEQLKVQIIDFKDILAHRERKINIVKEQLDLLVKKFGDERRTQLNLSASVDIDDEDLIPVEDIVITMSARGYFKRMAIDTYNPQKRGGVGVKGLETHEDDDVAKLIIANTHTDILLFSDFGKVYRVRGHQIPLGSRQAKGIPALNFIGVEKGEKILSVLPIEDYQNAWLFFTTVNGITKKTSLSEFERINRNGKIAIGLKEGDKLFDVIKVKEGQEIYIGASNGNMVRFSQDQVRSMGRTAAGVKGINLVKNKEHVVGLSSSAYGNKILSIGAKGLGKLTPVEEYRLTKRNAKGVRTLKVTPKTGALVYVGALQGTEDILIITSAGKIIRFAINEVREIGRSTSGVRLVRIEENEKIKSVAVFTGPTQIDDEQAPIDADIEEEVLEEERKTKAIPNIE